MEQPAPGWYTDPYDASRERVWNGSSWTSDTRAVSAVPPETVGWGVAPDASGTTSYGWSPPMQPALPTGPIAASPPTETNWRRLGFIAGAILVPLGAFALGYASHTSTSASHGASAPRATPMPTSPTSGTEPAYVNVPGQSVPRGIDTGGEIAQHNLDLAAAEVRAVMHTRRGTAMIRQDLDARHELVFDNPGTPIGGPGSVGSAVVSTNIDEVPNAPRRVVLALPGYDACYYVAVSDGAPNKYGVARGQDAVSHCYVGVERGLSVVRPETTWSSTWPRPTS